MEKLIYISHWRFPSEKTMSPLIMKTCEGFARNGFEVELWIPWRWNRMFKGISPFTYHRTEENFCIRRLPALDGMAFLPGSAGFYLLVATFNISVAVYALIRGLVRHVIFYGHDIRNAVLLALFRPRLFVEIHDFYKSEFGFLNRWCMERTSGFIVTNRYKMKKLTEEFGILPEKMLHQPNAVDVGMFQIAVSQGEARQKLSLPRDMRIILYTGHLFGWKGVDTLFDTYAFLDQKEHIYFVGGTDDDIESFKTKKERKKAENIVIVGRRPHAEIPLWLQAADIVVLPNTAKDPASKYETSPVKLFEYMASGRPIVASDLPSIRNVVDDSMVWFFEPDNAASLARAIHMAFQHPDEAAEKASHAKNEVQKYTWEKRAHAISDFIRYTWEQKH